MSIKSAIRNEDNSNKMEVMDSQGNYVKVKNLSESHMVNLMGHWGERLVKLKAAHDIIEIDETSTVSSGLYETIQTVSQGIICLNRELLKREEAARKKAKSDGAINTYDALTEAVDKEYYGNWNS